MRNLKRPKNHSHRYTYSTPSEFNPSFQAKCLLALCLLVYSVSQATVSSSSPSIQADSSNKHSISKRSNFLHDIYRLFKNPSKSVEDNTNIHDFSNLTPDPEEYEYHDDYYDYNYPGADYSYIDQPDDVIQAILSNQKSKKVVEIEAKKPRLPLPDVSKEIHEPGRCIMYDACASNADDRPAPGKNVNCQSNTKAVPLEGKALETYKFLCPKQFQQFGEKTCCPKRQLDIMKKELNIAKQLLSRCPICWNNFVSSVCAFSCHPDQSMFVSSTGYKRLVTSFN